MESNLTPADEIAISPNSDLDIILSGFVQSHANNTITNIPHVSTMKVERARLTKATDYFRAMFLRQCWKAAKSPESITLEDDNLTAMELLLRQIHGTLSDMPKRQISVAELWHLVMACDKYGIDPKTLTKLFDDWYHAAKTQDEHMSLRHLKFQMEVAFPCYAFDSAAAFQDVTKTLAYMSVGHIVERNPTNVRQMHMPPRVLQQLNAARGRLRNILHKGLFDKLGEIVANGDCACKEVTVFEYLRELSRIKVWPLEDSLKDQSINDILVQLRRFDSTRMRQYEAQSPKYLGQWERRCDSCSHAWQSVVTLAAHRVAKYFDGLCLDCMDSSKNLREGGDKDDDYWHYHEVYERYDGNCRITHGQPTWYFSFMGRREKRTLIAD